LFTTRDRCGRTKNHGKAAFPTPSFSSPQTAPTHKTNTENKTRIQIQIINSMKFAIFSLFTFVALVLGVTMPQKAVIISYPDNTPDSVLNQAKDAIKAAGGIITHEYKLIK
jgi:hypothetical protein